MNTDEIKEKIWRIADGIPFNMENMTIRTTDSGKLLVHGWMRAKRFEDITKEKIIGELDELKSSFSVLQESFNELDSIVKLNNLIVEFHISYDESGKEGTGLCSEIKGQVNWYI